jgi:hypothetical protein
MGDLIVGNRSNKKSITVQDTAEVASLDRHGNFEWTTTYMLTPREPPYLQNTHKVKSDFDKEAS